MTIDECESSSACDRGIDHHSYRHTGAPNLRLMVDPQTQSVGAFYVLDIAGENGKPPYSVWRGQRFRIVKGYVTEVEVYNYIEVDPKGLGSHLWPGGMTLPAKR